MPAQNMTEEQLRRVADAYEQCGRSQTKAALLLNIPRTTFQSQIREAARLGYVPDYYKGTVLPGFEIAKVTNTPTGDYIQQKPERGPKFEVPDGLKVKEVSAYVDGEGRIVSQWLKAKEGTIDPKEIAQTVREAFEGYTPASPAIVSEVGFPERMAMYIIADAHLGLLTHKEEVGEENNLEIAADRLRRCMRELVGETGSCEKALVINLGDAFHANDHKNMTPTSGHILDVASRIRRTARVAADVFRECVDTALTKHDNVIVKHLAGNHDLTASIILETAARIHYANEPRVYVDDNDADYYFLRYGNNLTGWHHGHRMGKAEEMAMCMANECREDWGETEFHYFYHGHLHHKVAKEVGGVIVEGFQTLSPPDAHHSGKYGSGRSMTSITLDKEGGENKRSHIHLKPITRRASVGKPT